MSRPAARSLVLGIAVSTAALALAAQAASGCWSSADDCELTLGYGCTSSTSVTGTGGEGGNTSSSGSTSSSSSGTAGGGGDATECDDVSECAATAVPAGPCAPLGKVVCAAGKCGVEYTAADAPSQRYGDCKRWVCDPAGKASEVDDDADVYDDGNPCTTESCAGGMLSRVEAPTGAACTMGGASGFCAHHPYINARVVCAECDPSQAGTCLGGFVCVQGTCVAPHCQNGVKDSGETDKDCGGTASGCLKCLDTQACSTYKDCWSGTCTNGVCQASTCSDGKQNNTETDQDCGGLCEPCGDTLVCAYPTDCLSGVCLPAATAGDPNTCALATCTDGVQNGEETGLDCGGSVCPPCAD